MRKALYFCLIFLTTIMVYGCATTSEITSSKGTIKIGMTKSEVLAVWGEPPQGRAVLGEEYVQGICLGTDERWELWDYPRTSWWGAHTISLQFNKDGKLVYIEPLYK